ncbi:MAG: response regulator [Chitinophagaceae bacterium]|nr:response regulator [Chitinophagaceae bacterium]
MQRQKILIVDDDADDREIIRDAFASNNFQSDYIFLENGDALLDYLNTNRQTVLPSLILLDLNMPGKDGREALKEIKTDTELQHIPTVVLTTSSSQRDRQIAYNLGANCFITKPDTFNKLVDVTSAISKLWLQES